MALSLKKTDPKKGKQGKKADRKVPTARAKKAQAEYDAPFVPRIPIVNLLPAELQEAIERARLKRLFAGLTVVLVVVMAALWGAQTALINSAQSQLEAEQATSAQLATEQNALAPVQAFYGQIDANRSTIQTTMQNEVLTSQVLDALKQATPPGVNVESFGLTLGGTTGTAGAADPSMTTSSCPSANPYEAAAPSAGCITVSGTATNRSVVGQWLDNLEAQDMFTVAFIPSTTADPEAGRITFTASVGLDAATAYQNRYANEEFLKAGGN